MATAASKPDQSLFDRISNDVRNVIGEMYPGTNTNPLAVGKDVAGLGGQAVQGLSNASNLEQTATNFLINLGSKNFWLRAGEGLAGILLLYAGVRGLTEGGTVGQHSATGTRKAARKTKSLFTRSPPRKRRQQRATNETTASRRSTAPTRVESNIARGTNTPVHEQRGYRTRREMMEAES
jgi:hypothetical protein